MTPTYDFYRCRQCQRLTTQPELTARLAAGQVTCGCGGTQLSPSNLPWWGWLLPRVWTFAVARVRAIGVRQACAR